MVRQNEPQHHSDAASAAWPADRLKTEVKHCRGVRRLADYKHCIIALKWLPQARHRCRGQPRQKQTLAASLYRPLAAIGATQADTNSCTRRVVHRKRE